MTGTVVSLCASDSDQAGSRFDELACGSNRRASMPDFLFVRGPDFGDSYKIVSMINMIYRGEIILRRVVTIGGTNKNRLISNLIDQKIHVNEYGWLLLNDDRLTISEEKQSIDIVEVTVSQIGFTNGASTDEIMRHAKTIGLGPCPLELALFFRLQYLDQPEGSTGLPATKHKAPNGSLTVLSQSLDNNPDFPKGFYLRRIDGNLWLRGYLSGDEHVWSPEDHLIFKIVEKEI